MSEYISVFERYEKKYILNTESYSGLLELMKPYMHIDDYGESRISNIYYDTPDKKLIRTSVEKPVFKEKLRLRCYGDVYSDSAAFVEIKRKYNGIVYKRRMDSTYEEAVSYLSRNGDLAVEQKQIKRETDRFVSFYGNIVPSACIFYDRTAYTGNDDGGIRVTFDSNIIYRDYDFDLTRGVYGTRLTDRKTVIMEIKVSGAFPLWLCRGLDSLGIYPGSFSKYGQAYIDIQNEKKLKRRGVYVA